jgi:hypothetical protein
MIKERLQGAVRLKSAEEPTKVTATYVPAEANFVKKGVPTGAPR